MSSLKRFASLPSLFRLDDSDFDAQPGIGKKLVRELATLEVLEDVANVFFIGPPGVGKTMLAVAPWHVPPSRPDTQGAAPNHQDIGSTSPSPAINREIQ